uniref:C-type lectin domain-containing protein n=1 Tax=Myripristis murdjan TaxID=586833 RepID=A0A667XDP0_9TELE
MVTNENNFLVLSRDALQEAAGGAGQPASWMWLGLFRDQWKWSDHCRSSFRSWHTSQPNNDGVCTLYNPSGKKWYDRGCDSLHPFYCHLALLWCLFHNTLRKNIQKKYLLSSTGLQIVVK